jgi:hypothetical protein
MSHRYFSIFVFGFVGALALVAVRPLSATVVFSENFESGTAGADLGSPWTLTSGIGTGTDPNPSSVKVIEDTAGTVFGAAGNKYGEFLDPRTGGPAARADNFAFGAVGNSLLKVGFDFHEVSGYVIDVSGVTHGNDPSSLGAFEPNSFNVQLGTNPASTSNRGVDFRLSNGKLWYQNGSAVVAITAQETDYALNAKQHLEIVASFNAADANYGTGAVNSGFYDVWLNGALVGDDLNFRVNSQAAQTITGIRLGTDNVSVQSFYIDNLAITTPDTPGGDFNADGFIDAADYVIWRKNTPGDTTKYEQWRSNFGTTGGSGASLEGQAGVPEPSTLGLLGIVLVGAFRRRRAERIS